MKNQGLIIVLACLLLWTVSPHLTKDEAFVTVKKTERVDGVYLAYTDSGVFKIEDDIRFFKFDSSDIYAKLEPKSKYIISYSGFRVPFLSWYKNIIDVEEDKR